MPHLSILPGRIPDAARTRQIEKIYDVATAVALAETAILLGDLDKAIEQLKRVKEQADTALLNLQCA
jgi:predicted negative regulator of RcsB-dependent stress response